MKIKAKRIGTGYVVAGYLQLSGSSILAEGDVYCAWSKANPPQELDIILITGALHGKTVATYQGYCPDTHKLVCFRKMTESFIPEANSFDVNWDVTPFTLEKPRPKRKYFTKLSFDEAGSLYTFYKLPNLKDIDRNLFPLYYFNVEEVPSLSGLFSHKIELLDFAEGKISLKDAYSVIFAKEGGGGEYYVYSRDRWDAYHNDGDIVQIAPTITIKRSSLGYGYSYGGSGDAPEDLRYAPQVFGDYIIRRLDETELVRKGDVVFKGQDFNANPFIVRSSPNTSSSFGSYGYITCASPGWGSGGYTAKTVLKDVQPGCSVWRINMVGEDVKPKRQMRPVQQLTLP